MNGKRNAPENTSARDPLAHLLGAMSAGTSDYITGMEADGQRQLLASDTLPSDGPWDQMEALGFVPGEPVEGDPMFRRCTLPEGWKREGSDHAMWSHIVDERGVRRVSIFYKAAFYDRSAHASISNVGYAFVTEAVYGDAKPALPEPWAVLTEDERQQYRDGLAAYLKQAEECPSVYGDRVPRVRTLIEQATR